jgi:DNA-binding transcriptional LysR family regulator
MSLIGPGLEAFMAVVEQATVHGAARRIGLTQTGVTQRIRALERQLGTTLFTRSRRGMRPTEEGEALRRYCQQALELEGALLSFLGAGDSSRGARVQITGPSSIMRARVIPAVTRALGAAGQVAFTFDLDDGKGGLAALKSGAAQLAVLERDEVVNELAAKLLAPVRHVLVVPPAWKARPVREIVARERIVDFDREDDATFRYLRRHGLFELARKDRHLANNIDALASLVAEGLGYSVLAADFARPLIAQGRLARVHRGKELVLEYALAWYPRHEMPAYFARLIDAVR